MFPGGQSHVFLVAVGMSVDDFCGSLACNGIVEFILHHSVKCMSDFRIAVIVNTTLRKNISDLLPNAAFTGPDGADALQQFTEIVLAKGRLTLLQPLIIQCKTLCHVFFQDSRGPDTEMGCPAGVHPIANRNNGVKIVKLSLPCLRLPRHSPMLSGYFHFGNNHFFV